MSENRFRMAVDAPDDHVRVIRVAGNLDRAAAAGLLRLIDAQVRLHRSGHRRLAHLLVDLEAIHSFEPGGLQVLRHARHNTAGHGVGLHMAGCSGRLHLLPLRARQVLGEFSTFPTVEIALTELTEDPRSADSARAGAPPPQNPSRPDGETARPGTAVGLGPAPASSPPGDSGGLPAPRRSPERKRAAGARRRPGDLLPSGRRPQDPSGRASLTEELT